MSIASSTARQSPSQAPLRRSTPGSRSLREIADLAASEPVTEALAADIRTAAVDTAGTAIRARAADTVIREVAADTATQAQEVVIPAAVELGIRVQAIQPAALTDLR